MISRSTVSEALAADVISLPIHADLTDDELDYVVEQFKARNCLIDILIVLS
jgi:dTDP-4-amino-4,6-dideoxygalactose transaminase